MNEKIEKYIEEIIPEIIQIRRNFHKFPELSFQEEKTSSFIINYLKDLAFNPIRVEDYFSVVCDININDKYPYYLLRADIDALPIEEKSGVSFSSENKGIMHACGHDIHTTILLALAKIIAKFKDELKCNLTILFQSGEELSPGGAKQFVESNFYQNKKYNAAFALHVSPEINTGKIGIHNGAFMASSDEIYIEIIGKGGHAAIPDNIINPIKIASEIFLEIDKLNNSINIASLKSQKSPLENLGIVSFGSFIADGATNVVPNIVNLKGTVRAFNENDRKYLHDKICNITTDITQKNGGECNIEIRYGYPAIFNDEKICNFVKNVALNILSKENVIEIPHRLTSDDFAFIAEQIPSCYFRLGCNSNTKLHSDTFNPDENCMLIGIKILTEILFTSNFKPFTFITQP
ncbi:M20 family metallopeptidase [Bacteroidales bacterium OttesenSCG-928-K03]|nr:M20 family metallopeptidase [Odoribacter sp. OttesenSCG-928-L07]MDL2241056.1 M20 family metallopeptidase [Bacteroidales bacterium OttesenSCG-928-K22]MDL2242589.1 M20 family metallopeptidase [Bacteroidales bacterium OttesenSCG-928-K03]